MSASLKALWRGANTAALRLDHDNYFDYNWILIGQDFQLASRTLVSPTDNTVVAYLKGVADETPIVTYQFMKESSAWKLFDVSYGGGTSPVQLSEILQNEIDKVAPLLRLPSFRKGYDGSRLQGPAAKAVRNFLSETPIHCEFRGVGAGGCRLGALTDSVDLYYVDGSAGKAALAVAFIEYFPDDGNAGDMMIAVWWKDARGVYDLQASGHGPRLVDARVVGMDGDRIVMRGLTVGPNDPNCCPTDATTFNIAYLGGLDVIQTRRVPRPGDEEYVPRLPFVPLRAAPQAGATTAAANASAADTSAFYAAARARFAAAAGRPMNGRDHVMVDFSGNGFRGQIATRGVYLGENGMPKDHNGSDVLIFAKAGLIVYAKPKASIARVVRPGDVLFRGTISKSGARGMAYAFKLGCAPTPYPVEMKGDVIEDSSSDLTGAAPVWDRSSCRIIGFSDKVANAKLTFGWIPGDELPDD